MVSSIDNLDSDNLNLDDDVLDDEQKSPEKRVVVIDGNSLMHRAFHAVPEYMTDANGTHTNAAFGFISMLTKMIDQLSPDAIICAFDAGIPQFRFDAIPEYKAQRPPTNPALKEQFPIIEEILESLNIPVVKLDGWEGDDILGTLAAKGDAIGVRMLLVSGDRDVMQLASEHTNIVVTKRGLSNIKIYDPDEVNSEYGINPDQIPDFIALKGDSSDNILGIEGIGKVNAAKLLRKYENIEGIFEHIDDIGGNMHKKLENKQDQLFANRTVATIVRDLDIDIDIDSISFPSYKLENVMKAFDKYGFVTQMGKFLSIASESEIDEFQTSDANRIPLQEPVEILTQDASIQEIKRFCKEEKGYISLYHDTTGGNKLFGTSERLIVYTGQKACIVEDEQVKDLLLEIFRTCKIICHDSKELIQLLVPKDSSIEALIDLDEIDMKNIFDVSLAAYLLDSSKSDYKIENIAKKYGRRTLKVYQKPKRGQPETPLDDEDLVARAEVIFELKEQLGRYLIDAQLHECYCDIELPLVPVLVSLERAGLEINTAKMKELSAQIGSKMQDLSQQVFDIVGEEFNIASPKQLSHILFEVLELPPKKKTRSGYSTDATVLSELSKMHPVPKLVIEYRELSKIKSTYLDTLPRDLLGDNRVHTTFNQTIAATGRLSSSDPNLQNIPVRTELGKQIRGAFVPYESMNKKDGDAVFLSADYSQIELRILAHLSGDVDLIDAFEQGNDFHRQTAANIFDLDVDEVTPELRSRAKAVNFGIIYGQQAFGLSQSLQISVGEAQEMIDRYFDAFPAVQAYIDELKNFAYINGYVQTMFGRLRFVPDVHATNKNIRQAAERVAINHPMQGSAADIIKMAMVAVDKRLKKENLESKMLLQVHDELDFSCPAKEIEKLSEIVKEEMENIVSLTVPMSVSVSYGPTWADAK